MLSIHGLPYVGRFACGWPRLSTTDPHTAIVECTPRGGVRAAETSSTRIAPAARSTREAAAAVAPVVTTSSTRRTRAGGTAPQAAAKAGPARRAARDRP